VLVQGTIQFRITKKEYMGEDERRLKERIFDFPKAILKLVTVVLFNYLMLIKKFFKVVRISFN